MAGKVNPIPEGYHTVSPYIIVSDANKALEFYGRALGAETRFKMPGPDGKSVAHAEMQIGNSMVMMGEEAMGGKSPQTLGGTPVAFWIYVEDADALFKRAVNAGCAVLQAMQDAFWGDRWGRVKDPFGHEWSFATRTEDVSPEEMPKRQAEFFASMKKQ